MADTLTPLQRAHKIAREHLDPAYELATTEETEKRRSLERQIENIKAGGPVIVCEQNRTMLRVWNPHMKRWAEVSMIHLPEDRAREEAKAAAANRALAEQGLQPVFKPQTESQS